MTEGFLLSNPLFRTVIALGLVILLLGALNWIIRKWGLGVRTSHYNKNKRLDILETLSLDHKRKLMLVRFDEHEHLLCLGENQETLLHTKDVRYTEDSVEVFKTLNPTSPQASAKAVHK